MQHPLAHSGPEEEQREPSGLPSRGDKRWWVVVGKAVVGWVERKGRVKRRRKRRSGRVVAEWSGRRRGETVCRLPIVLFWRRSDLNFDIAMRSSQ